MRNQGNTVILDGDKKCNTTARSKLICLRVLNIFVDFKDNVKTMSVFRQVLHDLLVLLFCSLIFFSKKNNWFHHNFQYNFYFTHLFFFWGGHFVLCWMCTFLPTCLWGHVLVVAMLFCFDSTVNQCLCRQYNAKVLELHHH